MTLTAISGYVILLGHWRRLRSVLVATLVVFLGEQIVAASHLFVIGSSMQLSIECAYLPNVKDNLETIRSTEKP